MDGSKDSPFGSPFGSTFDSFLEEEGIIDEVHAQAVKWIDARRMDQETRNTKDNKTEGAGE